MCQFICMSHSHIKLFVTTPTTTSTQPNLTSTDVGFDTNMTLHTTTQHPTLPTHPTMKLKSARKKGCGGLKFCMRPYLTKLTTTKHNSTLLCSGGASIFPLGLTLPQLQKQIKGQHQGQRQRGCAGWCGWFAGHGWVVEKIENKANISLSCRWSWN